MRPHFVIALVSSVGFCYLWYRDGTFIKRKLRAGDSIRKIQKLLIAENKKISLSTIVKVRTYLISENVITA